MSNTITYSRAIQITGEDNTVKDYDIVISAQGLNGPIQDRRVIEATTDLFLKTVAAAYQMNAQDISERILNATILKIDDRNKALIETDRAEENAGDVNMNLDLLNSDTQLLSGLADRISITAQDTIFAIRDLQYTEHVEARANLGRRHSIVALNRPPVSPSNLILDEDDEKHNGPDHNYRRRHSFFPDNT